MVFTDGKQTKTKGPFTELNIASAGLKKRGVAIYAMGIGKNVERDELEDIASANKNVFIAKSFKALEGVADILKESLCKGMPVMIGSVHFCMFSCLFIYCFL